MNIASTPSSTGQTSPDSTWNTLSLEQKQKLIAMLQYIK
jgi:hypothetical protein